ncbi:MAG: UbiD family decarboxylase [Solirubrobacteraceae bacterium]
MTLPATEPQQQSDLRGFLHQLAQDDRLCVIDTCVDPAREVARLMAEAEHREKAILFNSVRGSEMSLAYNLLGSRAAVAMALGEPSKALARTYLERSARRIPPQLTEREDAASQAIVLEGADADLRVLPMVVHSEQDAGAYITAGMVIAHDPDTGARNVSVNRIMIGDGRQAGIRMMPPQQLGQIHARAERQDQDLPIAVALGVHPLDMLAAAAPLPPGDDELALAGALRGQAVRLTPGVTGRLDVPAQAEIVLEGVVLARKRAPEGPFGDFLQYYVPVMDNHVLRVDAITHRVNPIAQVMYAGSREDVNLLGLSREAAILSAVEATGSGVHALRIGPTILGCTIAVPPECRGEAKTVGMAALAAYRWLKYCVIVDADVDVDDTDDVWWAIATRARFDRDLVTIPDSGGFPRDPHGVYNARTIIDATIPPNADGAFFRRRPPGGERLRLEDYAK